MVARKQTTRKERMAGTHPEVLDVDGAAEVLGVSRWLVLRLARQGEIPGKKIGREWRFRLSALLRWLSEPDTPAEKPVGEGFNLEALLESGRARILPREERRAQ